MQNTTTVTYDDTEHTYWTANGKLKSVTEIASEICNINPSFFKKGSAERGTIVHNELADYYSTDVEFDEKDLQTEEAKAIVKHLARSSNIHTEVLITNIPLGYAGTADLVSVDMDTKEVDLIVDFKSGNVNKKYCTVQLSLYKLGLESMGYNCQNACCYVISPIGITQIQPLSWDECWALQKSALDPIDKDILDNIESQMQSLMPYVERYKELEQEFRSRLLEQLQSAGATNYFGNVFDVSYVKPSTRMSLDTTRLRQEHPDIYQEYCRESKVAASVKLTNKGN